MHHIRVVGASLALIGISVLPRAAAAQVSVSPPQRNAPRLSAAVGQPNDPQTLAAIADKIDWDARTRGALMIVSPEDTYPNADRSGAPEDAAGQASPQGLAASSAGTVSILGVLTSPRRIAARPCPRAIVPRP